MFLEKKSVCFLCCCCSVTKSCLTHCLSCVWLFVTPWTEASQASLSFTISWNLLTLRSIESVMPSNHLILCCPFSSCLQSFPAFSNESTLHIRWPEYWSFSFSISPSNEYSSWFPLGLTVLITLLSRVFSIFWKHQFFGAQPSLWSNSYTCTWQ